jgi:hypothetical protein
MKYTNTNKPKDVVYQHQQETEDKSPVFGSEDCFAYNQRKYGNEPPPLEKWDTDLNKFVIDLEEGQPRGEVYSAVL